MPSLQIYNTLTQQLEPFQSLEPGHIKMYVCGPTVYDDAHLGHARCYITWDVVFRFLQFLGDQVTYVRNVTDVDDKIIARAKENQEPPHQLAERNYQRFKEDMTALNVLPPTEEPRATHHLEGMLAGIQDLMEKGMAYATPDGTVYYRTHQKADYGKLSKKPLEDLQSGARVDVDPHKESPLDFALWRGVVATEPDAWDAPWGRGRPGWHMECSTMSRAILGDQLDIHAGGADLIFPHHENEIAQSEAWTGKTPFVRYWLHNGFVNVSGEKMSKSLGNFSTIRTLLQAYDANTIRYFLLTHHYQMPVDFTNEALEGAQNRVVKIHRTFRLALETLSCPISQWEKWLVPKAIEESQANVMPALWDFQQAMANNFNTPQALAILNGTLLPALNKAIEQKNSTLLEELLPQAATIFTHLGFTPALLAEERALPSEALLTIYRELTGEWLAADIPPEDALQRIIGLRQEAKAIKNWSQADAIRKHLTDLGIALKDSKEGTTQWEWMANEPAGTSSR